ncbi:hypothetical protein AB0D86_46700 [Streptomyces sp. NPDC048324]|uniref:hypothetical protein n=1 Tax=Streptomyces sp. NPDC048324 TaxID=3157205 RepID=UPI00342206AF
MSVGFFVGLGLFFIMAYFIIGAPEGYDEAREDRAIDTLTRADPQLGWLLEFNRQQVLRYHQIVTKQASHSFRSGQVAATVGLVAVGVCLWVGLKNPGTEIKWFSGAIAGIGATVSGYINRTYMRMYERSVQQLSQYFDQPVVTGYFLTAERMAKQTSLSPDLQKSIINSVLAAAARIKDKNIPPNETESNSEEPGAESSSGESGVESSPEGPGAGNATQGAP